MTDYEEKFTDLESAGTVYRIEYYEGSPIHTPAQAKSRFVEEHDVAYSDLYAKVVTPKEADHKYVIVGEIDYE